MPLEVKEKSETSEDRTISRECTFAPNLTATKRINALVSIAKNEAVKPNSTVELMMKGQKHYNVNLADKSSSSSRSQTNITSISKNKSRGSKVQTHKTMVLQLNLTSN